MTLDKDLINTAKDLRKKILFMSYCGGSSAAHLGGALSIVEILSVLINKHINLIPGDKNNDHLILSKGHACLAYYASLIKLGFIDEKEMETFEKDSSNLMGHPIKNLNYGIEFSTGSLGMGLSIANGLCLANKKLKNNKKTFVIIGDGECGEGSIWEAALTASHYKLNNLIVFLDKNGFQQTGETKDILLNENFFEKWRSFGWNVNEINGHSFEEIDKSIENIANEKPNIIISNTIKGKGVSFAESNNTWHHSVLTKTNYEKALAELNEEY